MDSSFEVPAMFQQSSGDEISRAILEWVSMWTACIARHRTKCRADPSSALVALTAKAWLDPSPMENIFAFRENHRKPTSNNFIPASLGQIVEQSQKNKNIHGKFANTSMFLTFPTNIPALDQDQAPTRIWAPSFWVEGLAPMSPVQEPSSNNS